MVPEISCHTETKCRFILKGNFLVGRFPSTNFTQLSLCNDASTANDTNEEEATVMKVSSVGVSVFCV